MSCYFRHIKDVFETAGIVVAKDNKKAVDTAIHDLVGVGYKDCPAAWRAFKAQVGTDPTARAAFAEKLAARLNG